MGKPKRSRAAAVGRITLSEWKAAIADLGIEQGCVGARKAFDNMVKHIVKQRKRRPKGKRKTRVIGRHNTNA